MAVTLLFAAGCDDDDDPFVPVATELNITSGDNQTIAVNTQSAPLTVTLLDQNDDPIAGRRSIGPSRQGQEPSPRRPV